jgi:hypothetical protein
LEHEIQQPQMTITENLKNPEKTAEFIGCYNCKSAKIFWASKIDQLAN